MRLQDIKVKLSLITILVIILSLKILNTNKLFLSSTEVVVNTATPIIGEKTEQEISTSLPNLTFSEENPTYVLPTPMPTVTIPYFVKENFEDNEEIYLKIPKIGIDTQLGMACGNNENDYDFSKLDELPLWICPHPNDGYLNSLGLAGASIILGHRQWGPSPKIFAKLDKIESGDEVMVSSSSMVLKYKTQETVELKSEDLWQKISEINTQGKENNQSYLILITCTPYGTDWRRLLIITTLEKGEWK
jgi:LPXTG-site transpeptidase (sortase) family protein